MFSLDQAYSSRYQSLRKQLQSRPVQFRSAARESLANFTKRDRKIVRAIEANQTSVHEVYVGWRDEYVPMVEHVAKARTSKTLQKRLKEDFLLNSTESTTYADQLTDQRLNELKRTFILRFYNEDQTKVWRAVSALISSPVDEAALFFDRYINAELYRLVCKEHNITIYDKWRSWPIRQLQRLRDNRSERRLIKRTKKVISQLLQERSDVERSYDGIVARIFSYKIDLVSIFAVRQNYIKSLEKLPKKSRESAAKQLSLYEQHVKSVRTEHLDSLPSGTKLQEVQSAAAEIDEIILKIFDMDAVHRNGLMGQSKRYRELTSRINSLKSQIQP